MFYKLSVALVGLFVSAVAAFGQTGQGESRPAIVAHRGLLRHAPENTLANFRACLNLRLGLEVDLRRSRDGHLVCIHDATVDRTSNGKGVVSKMTLKELQQLDVGSWFAPEFSGQTVPTLEQVFQLIAGFPGVLVAVDFKVEDETVAFEVVKLADKYRITNQLLCIGYTIENRKLRQQLRRASKTIGVAVLANQREELAAALEDAQADWIYVRFLPTAKEVERVHGMGKKLFIAGTKVSGREPNNWEHVRNVGMDGLLTDFPLACRAEWRKKKQ